MRAKYPNLELIVYKATSLYRSLTESHNIICKKQIDTFLQTWANTATGFDLHGGVSGQAITDEYTTVVTLIIQIPTCNGYKLEYFHVVFFGDTIAYYGKLPNEQFFEDLKNRNMKSQKNQHYFDVKEVE